MNKLILTILTTFIAIFSYGQFCSTNNLNNQGSLNVTNLPQTTPVINANGTRLYYTFDVEPGCIYTFETCGLTSIDTYIRIYNGTNPATATLLWQNDDACNVQSRISFGVTQAATYSILITSYVFLGGTCNTLNNNNISIRYLKDCDHTNQECFGSTQICDDQTFVGNSSGLGEWQELNSSNRGCLVGNEHQSSWYYFIPTVDGTISMTISPQGPDIDYDFAIWEGGNCANLGLPIRCSYAGTFGDTGLGNGATDLSEGVFGNGWVAPLNITAGVFYVMLIDNFTANSTPFIIDFTFSTPALLNCTPIPLPIELFSFTGKYIKDHNYIEWTTASEINNDYFTLERSNDGENWERIYYTPGAGNSNQNIKYDFKDYNFKNDINYYKLTQFDFDGVGKESFLISVNNKDERRLVKTTIYDIMGRVYSDLEQPGLYIIHKEYEYGDVEVSKIYVH